MRLNYKILSYSCCFQIKRKDRTNKYLNENYFFVNCHSASFVPYIYTVDTFEVYLMSFFDAVDDVAFT